MGESLGTSGEDISCPYVSGKLMHFAQKYILKLFFWLSLVLDLLLIFHQISDSCSYKIILINKKRSYATFNFTSI